MISIERLYLSPGHNYFGHHGRDPDEHPMIEVPEVQCVAGRGLQGDRFFDYDELCGVFQVHDRKPCAFRRNVITRGVDLNTLVGVEFELQGLRFFGTSECSPCYWMDRAFAPGTEVTLKNRGGLRAKILSDGWLRVER